MLIRVAVPVPGLDLLTYSVSDDQLPPIGGRVIVPLGRRSVTGIVVEQGARPLTATEAQVREVTEMLDAEAFIPGFVLDLARWTAEYYAAGIGETLVGLLPPGARGARASAHKTVRVACITARGRTALATDTSGARDARERPPEASRADVLTDLQRHALEVMSESNGGMSTRTLASRGVPPHVLPPLARRGLLAWTHERVERDPFTQAGNEAPADRCRVLTDEQQTALTNLQALGANGEFRVALLHGVTGSGKTELYLRLAVDAVGRGRRVLMLVPEIALTPAVAALFRQTFGDRVAIQHSGLSSGERHDQWHRCRIGAVDVVVGTRSAVFAPVDQIGLIIVDEEHDPSYKQDEAPRYNGRDVAVMRGRQTGALVVLGSATPSMESYHNTMAGRYARMTLSRRVLDRPLARTIVVDMRDEYASEGPDVVLSRALRNALAERLSKGEQSLVLLNRRGFATSVFCRQCGGALECPNCSVTRVVHGEGARRRARCHYCNYSSAVPSQCPACAAPYMELAGFGTERVETEVARACPQARIARLDRDAIRRKGALNSLLARFREGAIDVLVGTQMIAKGHDFPRVTLVGVISADVGLGVADFRASERTFQLLTQVAGRAGRGNSPGEAIVQTVNPGHYSIELACRQDYTAFYEHELRFRRAMRYPPVVSLVSATVRARTQAAAMTDAASLVQRVRQVNVAGVDILGPAPAPLTKLRSEYRVQVLLKGTARRPMREALLAAIRSRPEIARRTVVDVDPVNVL